MKTLWIYLAVIYNVKARLNIKEGYFFGQEIKADYNRSDVHILTTSHDVSLDVCTKQCLSQPRCDFINYKFRSKMCYLIEHFNKNSTVRFSNKTGYVLGEKAKWNWNYSHPATPMTKTVCGPPPNVLHAEILGNMYTAGSKILYQCATSHYNATTLTCSYSGQWKKDQMDSKTPICYPEQCYNNDDLWVHKNSCYVLFCNITVSESDAKEMCRGLNGHLPLLWNQEKQNYTETILKNYVESGKFTRSDRPNRWVWIGFSDVAKESVFKWTGHITSTNYSNWHPSEPNGNLSQNCAVLGPEFNYEWADVNCTDSFLTLCEIDIY